MVDPFPSPPSSSTAVATATKPVAPLRSVKLVWQLPRPPPSSPDAYVSEILAKPSLVISNLLGHGELSCLHMPMQCHNVYSESQLRSWP